MRQGDYDGLYPIHRRILEIEAVKQITVRGYFVAEVSERLGVSTHSLHAWKKRCGKPIPEIKATDAQAAEIRRLKQELARIAEERDILKSNGVLCKECKMKNAFAVQRLTLSYSSLCSLFMA